MSGGGAWRGRAGLLALAGTIGAIVCASPAAAQVPLTGQVVEMPGAKPLAGVEISIKAIGRSVRSDSAGAFLMDSVPRGRYLVEAVKVGYRPFTLSVSVMSLSDPEYRIELTAGTPQLTGIAVRADAPVARLADFETRRAKGNGGRFLTAKDFQANVGRPTSDVIARIPGIDIIRGTSGVAWIGTNRGVATLRADGLPNPGLEAKARGATPVSCYAAVVLNNVIVFDGSGQNAFDINSLSPQDIIGFEYYAGAASVPVQWNTLRPTCGLVAIWTR